jgi:hypothetical protein
MEFINLMMISTSRTKILTLLLLLSTIVFSQDQMSYGVSLLREGDYYRSTGVFKELAHFSSDVDSVDNANTLAALSYLLSDNPDLANITIGKVSTPNPGVETLGTLITMAQGFGLTTPENREFLDPEGAEILYLFEALQSIKAGDNKSAGESFQKVKGNSYSALKALGISKLLEYSNKGQKSPLVGSIASTLLPGSGQMLAGHYFDGLQAIGFIGIFGLSTYAAYSYESERDNGYLMSIASGTILAGFWAANVLGAYGAAEYANHSDLIKTFSAYERMLWARLTDYIIEQTHRYSGE